MLSETIEANGGIGRGIGEGKGTVADRGEVEEIEPIHQIGRLLAKSVIVEED
jgi:hypothetical protein